MVKIQRIIVGRHVDGQQRETEIWKHRADKMMSGLGPHHVSRWPGLPAA